MKALNMKTRFARKIGPSQIIRYLSPYLIHYIAKAKSTLDLHRSQDFLQWVVDRALETGVLLEQVNPYNGQPLSVSPLTWSHSTFIVSVIKYLDKLKEIQACESCGLPKFRTKNG